MHSIIHVSTSSEIPSAEDDATSDESDESIPTDNRQQHEHGLSPVREESNSREHKIQSTKSYDPSRSKQKPEVIMVCDSIGKYVDSQMLFGSQRATIRRIGTATEAREAMKGWHKNRDVTTYIAHVGVNDIQNNNSTDSVTSNIRSLLSEAAVKYPKATVVFSEILHISNKDQNNSIDRINNAMEMECRANH